MITFWNILTSEFPPQMGGISDFCQVLYDALTECGESVKIWAPNLGHDQQAVKDGVDGGHLERVPFLFRSTGRTRLDAALNAQDPKSRLLVQYVPNAFGVRGMNLNMCHWLASRRRQGYDVTLVIHEPFFYFGWLHPHRNLLALTQRYMIWILLRGAKHVYVSTESWREKLLPYCSVDAPTFHRLPLPATLPVVADSSGVARLRTGFLGPTLGTLLGHFGTYGSDISPILERILPEVLRANSTRYFLAIGRNSNRFAGRLIARYPDLAPRVHSTGEVDGDYASLLIQACDYFLQPYPDGVTTRRTTTINLLAHSKVIITTDGSLTETLWRVGSPLILVPTNILGDWLKACLEADALFGEARLNPAAIMAFYTNHFSRRALTRALGVTA